MRFLRTGIDGLFTDQCDVAVIARAESVVEGDRPSSVAGIPDRGQQPQVSSDWGGRYIQSVGCDPSCGFPGSPSRYRRSSRPARDARWPLRKEPTTVNVG